jgi:hypothetical protein
VAVTLVEWATHPAHQPTVTMAATVGYRREDQTISPVSQPPPPHSTPSTPSAVHVLARGQGTQKTATFHKLWNLALERGELDPKAQVNVESALVDDVDALLHQKLPVCVPLADGKTMAALREQLKLNDEFISAVVEGQPVRNFVGTDTRPPDSLDMVEMGLFEEAQRAMIRETATRAMEQVLGGDSTLVGSLNTKFNTAMQGVCPLNKGVTMTGFTTSERMDELESHPPTT